MKKITPEVFHRILNKQFEINWYNITVEEIIEKWIDDWFHTYTTTIEKENEYRIYLLEEIKKYVPKSMIKREVEMFILNYWLRILND